MRLGALFTGSVRIPKLVECQNAQHTSPYFVSVTQ